MDERGRDSEDAIAGVETLRLQRSYFKIRSYFLDQILFSHFPASAKIRSDLKNRIAGASGKEREVENLTNDTPPKKGFWTPLVWCVFHPPHLSVLSFFSCARIHDRADQKLFWRGPNIFGRARSPVRFPPPIRFAPPPYHGPRDGWWSGAVKNGQGNAHAVCQNYPSTKYQFGSAWITLPTLIPWELHSGQKIHA